MESALVLQQLFEESGYFIAMFFVSGIVLDVFTELLKKQIFPKTEDEATSKKCPSWIGMLIGIANTVIFTIFSVLAHLNGTPHCQIIGGFTWIFVWIVGFYAYQMGASLLIKLIMKKMFPCFMTGFPRPIKPKGEKVVYQVPKGSKVEFVDGEDLNE